MIQALHHVQLTIPIGAEDAARRFYVDTLGLREIDKPEVLRGRGGLWVAVGDRELHLGVEDGIDRARTRAHVALEVDDLAAVEAALRQAGLDPAHDTPLPGLHRMKCRDPFGNGLEFVQRTSSG